MCRKCAEDLRDKILEGGEVVQTVVAALAEAGVAFVHRPRAASVALVNPNQPVKGDDGGHTGTAAQGQEGEAAKVEGLSGEGEAGEGRDNAQAEGAEAV